MILARCPCRGYMAVVKAARYAHWTQRALSVASSQTEENRLTKSVLNLEEIDINLYRGKDLWKPVRSRAVFGGQVLGQALVAAGRTKPDGLHAHSMHSYFVRPGTPDVPIIYHVERTRDGSSFSTRTVNATQKGQSILTMLVSYHREETGGINYQSKMPDVPHHAELEDARAILTRSLRNDKLSEGRRLSISGLLSQDLPMDMKPVHPKEMYGTTPMEPKTKFWVKAVGRIGDDQNLHRCVATYISDWYLLGTPLILVPEFKIGMMTSLDHSMWYHAPFHADEWMLYECENTYSGNNRSLIVARAFREDGVLAISITQEGVIRPRPVQ